MIGIHHGMDEATYHADPCPAPSLSSGIIRALRRSPAHAYYAHPKLGAEPDTDSPAKDDGVSLHQMLLGAGADLVPLDFPDWRTKAAQEARDDVRKAGAVPLLRARYDALRRAAEAMRRAMPDLPPGSPEATLIWQEGPTWCRARVDWLPENPALPLYDIKTTGKSADPAEWQRQLVAGYCIQAAWYLRGARALGLRPRDFVFLAAETAPPYGVSQLACAPSLMAYAEREIERAIAIWRRCLAADDWPGYPREIAYVDAPGWLLERQEEQALNDDILEDAL